MKKIIFLFSEDLRCKRASLILNNRVTKSISLNPQNDVLSSLLSFSELGISEYWIHIGDEIRKTYLNNSIGIILKILKRQNHKSEVNCLINDKIMYYVYKNEVVAGSYFITKSLEDVHDIEHYCGIFKCLDFEIDLSIVLN